MTAIAVPAQRSLSGPLLAYLRLEVVRALRNRRYLITTLVFPLAFYLMYTAAGLGGTKGARIDGAAWSTYFMVSMAAFGAVGATLNSGGVRLAAERASGWTRQLRVTPLPPAAYLVTKIATALIVTLPAIAAVGVAGIVLNGVELDAATWIRLLISLWLGALPFAALGILLGYLFDADTAQAGQTVVFFLIAILGGLLQPISALGEPLGTIARVLPSYHFGNLGWTAIKGAALDPTDVVVLGAYTVVFGALVAWRYLSEERARG